MLLVLFNMTICGAVVAICLSPISTDVANAFNVDVSQVTWCAIIFTATYIPMSFVTIQLFKTLNAALVMRIGATFVLLGGWTRSFAKPDVFWPVILGNLILSLSGPILLSTVIPTCNKWFGDGERSVAAAILGMPTPLGAIIGLMQAPIFFVGIDSMTTNEVLTSFQSMVNAQNYYITASWLIFVLLVRDKPSHPPSAVAL